MSVTLDFVLLCHHGLVEEWSDFPVPEVLVKKLCLGEHVYELLKRHGDGSHTGHSQFSHVLLEDVFFQLGQKSLVQGVDLLLPVLVFAEVVALEGTEVGQVVVLECHFGRVGLVIGQASFEVFVEA